MNQATHYLDASQIYGSSLNKSNSLREFKNGRLLTSQKSGRHFLPITSNPNKFCQNNSDECYKAGKTKTIKKTTIPIKKSTIPIKKKNPQVILE